MLLLLVALAGGAIWLTLPSASRTDRIAGLSGPVDITFDADWIPRIRAANSLDAAAALGYIHARDRLFQMELMRRAASGRLSELIGSATLGFDRQMRTLGLRQHAVADLATLPADARAMLEAYAQGVNAWIALKGRFAAPEFLLLGAPEPWAPADSLLWAKTMGLWLSMNWHQELSRLALSGQVPAATLDQLWPPRAAVPAPYAQRDLPSGVADTARRLAAMLPGFPGLFTMPQTASNEWAVDGQHTATGAPLLAGDPHLQFSFPGIWYLARIDTPQGTLAGATAPGVPFMVLGRNSHIAWTFTTTGADVQDIFVETPAGPGEYQTPDGPQPFTVREERIGVRGQPDQMLVVRETRHGPVISDLDNPSGPILAVSMANLQPEDTAAAGLLALNNATTVQQAGEAAAMISSPVQNLLAADAKTIGLFVTGRVPVRKAGDGAAPAPGDGSHDWVGWAEGQSLPYSVSPPSGRLVNANEPVWPADFPVFMGRDTFGDWRAQRIRQMLASTDRHTAADFAAIQADVADPFAQQILPRLRLVQPSDPASSQALTLLRDWDGSATMDSPAPLLFNAWQQAFIARLYKHLRIKRGLGAPVADLMAYALSPAGAHLCGDACDKLLQESLDDAVQRLRRSYGDEATAWRWGAVHRAVFMHPLLRAVPALAGLGAISIASPGDNETVDRGGMDADFQSVHGASYRGVYDLADLDRSLFMMAPGQSGNLFSHHARDFVTRWRDGATIKLGPAASATTGTVHLTP